MRQVSLLDGRLSASRVGFGTSALHHAWRAAGRAALLHRCLDRGITYFDTAPLYGHGLAERELGRLGFGRRRELTLATKFGIPPDPLASRVPLLRYPTLAFGAAVVRVRRGAMIARARDFRAAAMRASLDRSLRNLRAEHVSILFLHDPWPDDPGIGDELLVELERARAAGKVGAFGVSGHPAACLAIAQRYAPLGELLQADAGCDAAASDRLRDAGLPPHITFGHLRAALAGESGAERSATVRRQLARAVRDNPQGVVLFSTRRTDCIDDTVARIEALDQVAVA